MSILSIQSHVVYGYVGNKAAVYPLQSMGYDVWPVNTVQFSTHTGYPDWKGEVFSSNHIKEIIDALLNLGVTSPCKAVLSGYMGSKDICLEVLNTVKKFKAQNNDLIYLCDPVMGNNNCYVKPEVLEFFKNNLQADIITPNQFEAETLSGIKITDNNSIKSVAEYFHNKNIAIVVITGIKNEGSFGVFVSDKRKRYIVKTEEYNFDIPVNGTGDLFSAVFLGSYLKTKNALESTKNAVYYMNLVVKNTLEAKVRELQVISTRYDIKDRELRVLEL